MSYIESCHVKNVLKLFRGFISMGEDNLDAAKKKKLLVLMDAYVRGPKVSDDLPPAMWLSIIDMAARADMQSLAQYG